MQHRHSLDIFFIIEVLIKKNEKPTFDSLKYILNYT